MSKEIWIAAHDQLIDEYMIEHPEATEQEASAATESKIQDRFADILGTMSDVLRMEAKERGL